MCGLSSQLVHHSSGLSSQVSLYKNRESKALMDSRGHVSVSTIFLPCESGRHTSPEGSLYNVPLSCWTCRQHRIPGAAQIPSAQHCEWRVSVVLSREQYKHETLLACLDACLSYNASISKHHSETAILELRLLEVFSFSKSLIWMKCYFPYWYTCDKISNRSCVYMYYHKSPNWSCPITLTEATVGFQTPCLKEYASIKM